MTEIVEPFFNLVGKVDRFDKLVCKLGSISVQLTVICLDVVHEDWQLRSFYDLIINLKTPRARVYQPLQMGAIYDHVYFGPHCFDRGASFLACHESRIKIVMFCDTCPMGSFSRLISKRFKSFVNERCKRLVSLHLNLNEAISLQSM